MRQTAVRFRQIFKGTPKVDDNVMTFYNEFSRKVFTYNKRFVKNIKETEKEYFKLYMDIVLLYVKFDFDPHFSPPPVSSDNFFQIIHHIRKIQPSQEITKELDASETLRRLRILLWGYNSIFSSTRMYRKTLAPSENLFTRIKKPVTTVPSAQGGGGGV